MGYPLHSGDPHIELWRLPLRFIEAFTGAMKELHLVNKVIGLEYGNEYMHGVSLAEIRQIEQALPNADFVPAHRIVWEQRMVKTEWGIHFTHVDTRCSM